MSETKHYSASFSVRAPEGSDDGLLYFMGTTEAPDAHDSIIRTDGIDLERYRRNPVVLLDHNNSVDSIAGRAEVINVVANPKGLEFGIRFASQENPRAAQAERLARAGFLRGASIGFTPTRVRMDLAESEAKLLGLGRWGYVVEECELAELTLVPIGSNPEALKRAISAGAITEADARAVRGSPRPRRRQMDDDLRAVLLELANDIGELPGSIDGMSGEIVSRIDAMGAAIVAALGRLEARFAGDSGAKALPKRKAIDLDLYAERIKRAAGGGAGPRSE